MFCQGDDVSHEGDVEQHISVKDEGTRGVVTEGGDWITAEGVHGCCESFIDE